MGRPSPPLFATLVGTRTSVFVWKRKKIFLVLHGDTSSLLNVAIVTSRGDCGLAYNFLAALERGSSCTSKRRIQTSGIPCETISGVVGENSYGERIHKKCTSCEFTRAVANWRRNCVTIWCAGLGDERAQSAHWESHTIKPLSLVRDSIVTASKSPIRSQYVELVELGSQWPVHSPCGGSMLGENTVHPAISLQGSVHVEVVAYGERRR